MRSLRLARTLHWLIAAATVAGTSLPAPLAAQTQETLPAERLAARDAYRAARFGLFIHWGVYSLLGQGEWVMQNRELPASTYEWLASTINTDRFDASEWVALAN